MPPQLYRLNRALGLQKVGEKHRKTFAEQDPPPPPPPNHPPPPPPVSVQVQKLRRTSSFDSCSSSLSSLSFDDERPVSGSSAKFSFSTLLTVPSSIAEPSTPSSSSTVSPPVGNSSGIIPIGISPSIRPAPFRPKTKVVFHRIADYEIPPESHKHSVLPLTNPHLITFENLKLYHRHVYNIISTLEENTDAPSLDFIYHPQIRLIHRPYTEWFYSHEHTRSRFSTGNWRAEIRKGRVGDCPMTDGTAAIIAKECYEFIQLCEAWLEGAGKRVVGSVLEGENGEAKKKNKEERWLVSWWRRDVEEVAAHLEASLEGVNGGNVVPFKRLGGVL